MGIQNCTLLAHNGRYSASFTEKSFVKGRRFKVYSGIYVGDGYKRGEKCVVKVFSDRMGTRNLCSCEAEKSLKARELAKAFNNFNVHKHTMIRITYLYWAPIDEISVFKKLFFSGKRRLSTKELVLFEDDLRVDDYKPGRIRKLTLYMDSLGRLPHCKSKDLEAFAHFSYHHTGGDLVLCGLEGVQDSDGFLVKTPTIHSRNRNFGSSDLGENGIAKFFDHHVCNEICQHMIKYNRESELLAAEEDEVEALRLDDNRKLPTDVTDHRAQLRNGSTLSQQTERMSDFLEPTAPCIDAVLASSLPLSPTSPPSWVCREQADLFQLGRVLPQMSVDSEMSDQRMDEPMSPAPDNANIIVFHATGDTANFNTRPSSMIAGNNAVTSFSVLDEGYDRSEPTDKTNSACATAGILSRSMRFSDSGNGTSMNYNAGSSTSGSPRMNHPLRSTMRQSSLPTPVPRYSLNDETTARYVMTQQVSSLPEQPTPTLSVEDIYTITENPPSYIQSQKEYCRMWVLQNQAEMIGPLQNLAIVDANGNQMPAALVNARHL